MPSLLILAFTLRSAEQETAIADRAGRAVARQPDDADVVGEVLAAELGADAELVRRLEQLRLELDVAERLTPCSFPFVGSAS